ncbi:protein wntless homolog B-like [Anneissia japonica]|uniref:protein wntless homolog B-like n=1 Tax=Anneissia japonica TaxID=1529436 RepID=UPI0014255F2D|nr:protein wntless homolog B-like [Anneissia japonica]
MAGVILENLSNKKLVGFCLILLLVQIVCFLVGGLIAPKPTDANSHLATKCIDPSIIVDKWFIPNGAGQCNKVLTFDEAASKHIEANQIVFAVQMPHRPLNMSRSFQFLLTMLRLDTQYKTTNPDPPEDMTMIVRIGYRNSEKEEWKELAKVTETRKLECTLDSTDDEGVSEGQAYDCDPLPFFELSSCHYNQYLVNIRLPVGSDDEADKYNTQLGSVTDIWITEIHQTGGFTLVWFTMKTVITPIPLAFLIWFWLRISKLRRPPVLMEKFVMVLGISVTFLNVPIEWLTFWFEVPYMLLISDIRQGIFYATLLSSWIVFTGEHLMDTVERARISAYSKQVGTIAFCCFSMFVFDMCERGVQLSNPFFTLWSTETGKNLAMLFLVMAGICFGAYFLFLCFMVWQVFRNISIKRLALPHMLKARRLHYEGLIYRFKFFMLFTLLCAALTVIFFILSQVYEDHYKMGHEKTLQISSAFFTGVYGMWNIYVVAVIFLYAPSHKKVSTDDDNTSDGSHVEFELNSTATTPSPEEQPTAATQQQQSELKNLLTKTAID